MPSLLQENNSFKHLLTFVLTRASKYNTQDTTIGDHYLWVIFSKVIVYLTELRGNIIFYIINLDPRSVILDNDMWRI